MILKHKTKKKLIARALCLFILMPTVTAQAQSKTGNPEQAAFVKLGLKSHVFPQAKSKDQTQGRVYLFPNPARDWVEIKFEGKNQENQVLEIRNRQGIQLLSQKWNGEKINVSQFPPGIYIVTLKRKQEVYSQKLVVNR